MAREPVSTSGIWLLAGSSRLLSAVAALALAGGPATTPGAVLISREEALALAFPPPAVVERRTAWLDESQLAEARRRAGEGVELLSAHIPYYVAIQSGKLLGTGYFDTHRVRSAAQTVFVVVTPEDRIERLEVIAFDEPDEYRARPAWLDQFEGRRLDDELALRRGIRPMTGASLTARALTQAARRVLALHAVIAPTLDPPLVTPPPSPAPPPPPAPPR